MEPSLSLRSRSAISASSVGNISAIPELAALSCTSSTKGLSLSRYSADRMLCCLTARQFPFTKSYGNVHYHPRLSNDLGEPPVALGIMHLSKLHVSNYRCLKNAEVRFRPGPNVILGENNAGKTAVLSALRLVLGSGNKRLGIQDFSRSVVNFTEPISVTIQATLQSSGSKDTVADMAVVATWLTRLESPWEATLTYKFFLPEEQTAKFKEDLGASPNADRFWRVTERYLDRYIARTFGGQLNAQIKAEPEALEKISCELLDAIRDVNTELFSGGNPLLKRMLLGILDRQAEATVKQQSEDDFGTAADGLIKSLIGRLDLEHLFKLIKKTGAGDGGIPNLGGRLAEADLLASLKLVIETAGEHVPATHNGLGYNNLIYISLLLQSLETISNESNNGQNAIVFPVLLIEEPEAHLHPALQYKLLEYIRRRIEDEQLNRQVFLTTHSTQITAASELDSVICMQADPAIGVVARYPGRAFADDADGRMSKKYIERYLDATKSNILFSKAILFVEGIAELLLMPVLARYANHSLEDKHVALVAVGGLTFKHFLPLFGVGADARRRPLALKRRVACLVDADPAKKAKSQSSRWQSCFPYELNSNPTVYDYNGVSGTASKLQASEVESDGSLIVRYGTKTLEYDLALANGFNGLLLTTALKHREAFGTWLVNRGTPAPAELSDLLGAEETAALGQVLDADMRSVHEFASYYLACAEKSKGEHAFELAIQLNENLKVPPAQRKPFTIPPNIQQVLDWVCA